MVSSSTGLFLYVFVSRFLVFELITDTLAGVRISWSRAVTPQEPAAAEHQYTERNCISAVSPPPFSRVSGYFAGLMRSSGVLSGQRR